MPEVSAPHLLGYLFEVGPTINQQAVTHSELLAWQQNTGIALTPWEAQTLRALSSSYLAESFRALDEVPSPMDGEQGPPENPTKLALRRLAGK